MATSRQLAGQEAVASLEAGQGGEAGEAGVGGQHEDEEGGALQGVREELADRPGAVDRLPDLGQHRGRAVLERDDLDLGGQERDAEEHDGQAGAHVDERLAGVLPSGLAEGADAVGDGLDPGDSRPTGGERLGEEEGTGPHVEPGVGGGVAEVQGALGIVVEGRQVATEVADEPVAQQHAHVDHEEVGGDGEQLSRLAYAAQVPVHHEDDEHEGDGHPVGGQPLEHGDEGGGAGGHRHGDGEEVADQQGGSRHLGGHDAEGVPRDQVGATGGWIGLDRLPVGEDEQPEHEHQGGGQRHQQREGG